MQPCVLYCTVQTPLAWQECLFRALPRPPSKKKQQQRFHDCLPRVGGTDESSRAVALRAPPHGAASPPNRRARSADWASTGETRGRVRLQARKYRIELRESCAGRLQGRTQLEEVGPFRDLELVRHFPGPSFSAPCRAPNTRLRPRPYQACAVRLRHLCEKRRV